MSTTPADFSAHLPRSSRRLRLGLLIAVVALIFLLILAKGLAGFYVSYLWFHSVHLSSVFEGVLVTKILLSVSFCVIFFVLMSASLIVADRCAPTLLPEDANDELVERYRETVMPRGRLVRTVVAVLFALLAGVGTDKEWNNWDLFRYHVSFGATDPEYHKDIGFYVFQLPFIKFLPGWAFEALIVILLVTVVAEYLNGGIRFQGEGPRVSPAVKAHLSVILGVMALIQGVNYYLDRLELVLSKSHVVDGATATDVHANKPADELLIAIAVIAAILFLLNIRARGWILPIVGVVVWALVWILIGHIYPAVYQAVRVNPSELSRETPYIARNIAATREAYGLNGVTTESQNFDSNTASEPVTAADISGNTPQAAADRQTIANVQLLDPTQILPTFDNLQRLRPFYSINNLSVDRYVLDENGVPTLTETLTGVRELNNQVPSGFTTQHLQYTHGYGAVVAPANETGVNANGNPSFSLQNVPPQGTPSLVGPGGKDTGAQVYFGQGSDTSGFVIAHSKQEELDYDDAQGNEVQGQYEGNGGVPVGNVLRRAVLSVAFGDPDILLSGQITGSSQIIYNRNITARLKKAAPFLKYDADPYSVILGNQIYWVVDAYTTTANYPYSQDANTSRVSASSGLSGTFNYVRNSVKVVVNAYTGKMYFFVIEQSDPIIQVYERAFHGLFTPVGQANRLIPGITSHWRYPQDLFEIQTNMYGRYHLTNVDAFYNQANAWNISQDPGSGRPDTSPYTATLGANDQITYTPKLLNPEYELAALPGQTQQKFLIVQPFVPYANGNSGSTKNLSAVMFASADPGDYGQLTVYQTPPGEQVSGPPLVQSEIVANTEISSELTLLNQQGSQVLLGEVVSVPIANTLLYVQPVYVQSSNNQVPLLKDVIVVYDNQAYHSSNASLDNALCQIQNPDGSKPFEMYCNTAPSTRPKVHVPSPTTPSSSSTTTSTTTTPSTTTPPTTSPPPTTTPVSPSVTAPPANASVAQLLADAQAAYDAAEVALKQGNLALYQADLAQEQKDLVLASSKYKKP